MGRSLLFYDSTNDGTKKERPERALPLTIHLPKAYLNHSVRWWRA